jgi:pimeloyl-ACP methyl ester carboxylesterase
MEQRGLAASTIDRRLATVCGTDRTELGRFLFTAEQLGHQRAALSVLLGLNGLRVSEACETDIGDLGLDAEFVETGRGFGERVLPLEPGTKSDPQEIGGRARAEGRWEGVAPGRYHRPCRGHDGDNSVTETRVGDQRPTRVVAVDKRTWVQGRPAAYSVAGQGMPVVLLHGWGLGHHTYRDVIERIAAEGVRVVAPAMPGFGGTADLPDDSFSMSGYARWVIDLLDVLGIDEPAVVVGHSFGGGVSIRLAYDHPDRVRSLVLVNSVGGSAWKQGKTLKSIAERPLWDWGLHFPADIWPVRQATRVLPIIAEDVVPNVLRNPLAFVRVANLARRADLRRELEALRDRGLPVTLLWASRDGIIPRESFEALCVASGVEGTVVDGSHSWLLADPEQFGEIITNDMRVAKAARELEAAAAKAAESRPKGLRRVTTLRKRADADQRSADRPAAG